MYKWIHSNDPLSPKLLFALEMEAVVAQVLLFFLDIVSRGFEKLPTFMI